MRLAPLEPGLRLRGIDVARGVALLGILLVNARFFFAPFGFASDPSTSLDGSEREAGDAAAWAFVETLCSFKFISLFSMLFGLGLAMQAARARERGGSPWPTGLRRLGLLAVVGIVHWTLVWYGDILMIYALLGVVVLAVTGLPRKLVGWTAIAVAGVTVVVTIGYTGLTWVGLVASVGEPAVAEIPAEALTDRGFAAMMAAGFDPFDPAWIEAELAAFREGPFADATVFRTMSYLFGFVTALFSYGWQSLLMMLCGVYAFKAGLFAPEGSALRRKVALPALATGLALSAVAVVPSFVLGFDSMAARVLHVLFLGFGALVLPVAYAAIVVEWWPRLPGFLATALERTGRMSFTVFLGESLVCTFLASWWGLAWFGSIDDAEAALIAFSVWTGFVVFATLWLGVFPIGPFEWLWRRATYLGGASCAR